MSAQLEATAYTANTLSSGLGNCVTIVDNLIVWDKIKNVNVIPASHDLVHVSLALQELLTLDSVDNLELTITYDGFVKIDWNTKTGPDAIGPLGEHDAVIAKFNEIATDENFAQIADSLLAKQVEFSGSASGISVPSKVTEAAGWYVLTGIDFLYEDQWEVVHFSLAASAPGNTYWNVVLKHNATGLLFRSQFKMGFDLDVIDVYGRSTEVEEYMLESTAYKIKGA